MAKNYTMDTIVSLAKSRGFVYPGSEIYGGLANTWDYGNLGVELKNNIKKAWWKKFVQESKYNVGIDCAILMNPQTWVASGHLAGFSDPLMDCKECHERFRADKLIEEFCAENGIALEGSVDAWSNADMEKFVAEKNIPCPSCGKHDFTPIRQFNLMFKTFQGVTEDAKNTVYLRPETAQGIFVNFKNVQRTARKKLPFGIAQIGKSFRNEITPGNFTFRTREFEQMELEFFCKPDTDLEWFSYWKDYCQNWLYSLGMKKEMLRARDHEKEELSFYSKATTDLEFLFPFGWGELWGIADRTNYDLSRHEEVSGQDMKYFDDETNEHVDNVCAFVCPGEVVLAWCEDKDDPQYAMSQADALVLESERDARGRKIKVHRLPVPKKKVCIRRDELEGFSYEEGEQTREEGERLAASYVNFYISNGAVLLPQFQDENDQVAVKLLSELFPTREVIPIQAREILLGGGNIHCITQQIPQFQKG